MPNNFFVLAHPRSGSYHLVSLLNSCNDVVCDGEVFKASRVELPKPRLARMTIDTVEERDRDPALFLSALRNLNPNKHHGFKVFVSHIRNVAPLDAILHEPERKAVILYRDFPATYASSLRAQSTGVWVRKVGWERDEDLLQAPIRYTPETFAKHLAGYIEMMRYFQAVAAEKNAFVLTYDQIGRPDVMTALLNHVGSTASPDSLTTNYQKQFRGALRDGVENWDEFEAAIAALEDVPSLAPTIA